MHPIALRLRPRSAGGGGGRMMPLLHAALSRPIASDSVRVASGGDGGERNSAPRADPQAAFHDAEFWRVLTTCLEGPPPRRRSSATVSFGLLTHEK